MYLWDVGDKAKIVFLYVLFHVVTSVAIQLYEKLKWSCSLSVLRSRFANFPYEHSQSAGQELVRDHASDPIYHLYFPLYHMLFILDVI